jgi:hypothetical protein
MFTSSLGRIVLAGLALIPAAPSAAQVTFFAREGLVGRAFAAYEATPDLYASDLRERAASLAIRQGQWQVCTEPYFRGYCVTLAPGDYRSPVQMGLPVRAASAREVTWIPGRPGGVGNVVLYEGPNLTGRRVTISGPTDHLGAFNDRARSMVVAGGDWELCEHDRYRGRCRVFAPGRYASLAEFTADLSSLRPLAPPEIAPPLPPLPPPVPGLPPPAHPGWGGGVRVVLYEFPNFGGRSLVVASDFVGNLGERGFNNRASSLRVERGYWLFCSEPNFFGECRTFGPGDYAALPWVLDNRISSGRRVANEYPYDRPPGWSWGDADFGRPPPQPR